MQIDIDTEILETILVYSTTAERLDEFIHNTVAANAVHQISLIVSRLLSESFRSEPAEEPTQEGEAELNVAVAVDQNGVLYIADTFNDRVRRVGTDGIISTIAGGNGHGYSGDGEPAEPG